MAIKGLSDPKSLHLPGTGVLREPRLSKLAIPKPLDFGVHPSGSSFSPPMAHPIAVIRVTKIKIPKVKMPKVKA